MITKTLNEIANLYSILNELAQNNDVFKVSYWIVKNLNILEESYDFLLNERQKLYSIYLNEPYVSIDEDGQQGHFLLKDDNKTQEFVDKFNELLNMDCPIEPYLIKLSVLLDSNLQITPKQLAAIECLIDETEGDSI